MRRRGPIDPAKRRLNDAVLALGVKDRPAAVEILARFGAINTPQLKQEDWSAVTEACEAALAALKTGVK